MFVPDGGVGGGDDTCWLTALVNQLYSAAIKSCEAPPTFAIKTDSWQQRSHFHATCAGQTYNICSFGAVLLLQTGVFALLNWVSFQICSKFDPRGINSSMDA